jgi:hypothetical protein
MTTFNWNIIQLNTYPEKNGKQDVVFTVHWILEGVDDESTEVTFGLNTHYTGSAYGSIYVTLDPDAPYTPYTNLTKDQLLSWVWKSVNKDETETSVQTQIDEKKNPTVVILPLPFGE